MKNQEISKEWLKVNRICKEIRWLMYDKDYSEINLKEALRIMEELKEMLGKKLEK